MSADPSAGRGATASYPYYRGPRRGARLERPAEPRHIESLKRQALEDAGRYRPDPDLEAAVNTALLLGLPLLVTGEPGCGKTQLGAAVAHAFGWDHELFETKSTTQARDLFYAFDVVGRFNAREMGADAVDPRYFIDYAALGRAILKAHEREAVAHMLPLGHRAFAHPGTPRRSVVVIDEIDKASRDFPNDILNEIDRMYFRAPELGRLGLEGTPPVADVRRPFVLLTSNSEKKLPDAFLRRCAYHHIREPDRRRLEEIIEARLSEYLASGGRLMEEAVQLYLFLRSDRRVSLGKRPGVAELLNWLQAMIGRGARLDAGLDANAAIASESLSVLLKTSEDLERTRGGGDGIGYFDVFRDELAEMRARSQ